jgi:hypothetical protein
LVAAGFPPRRIAAVIACVCKALKKTRKLKFAATSGDRKTSFPRRRESRRKKKWILHQVLNDKICKEECMGMQLSRLKNTIMALFIIFGMTLSILAGNAMAGAKVKAEGVLTSREGNTVNRSVIINDKGYLVSPSARILDANGRTISLDRIPLPLRVYFHYEYTKTGPVITFMKGYPNVMPQ